MDERSDGGVLRGRGPLPGMHPPELCMKLLNLQSAECPAAPEGLLRKGFQSKSGNSYISGVHRAITLWDKR